MVEAISSDEMRSPTPSMAAAMPDTSSSSTSLGKTDATMKPSMLTTAAPMMSGEAPLRPRKMSCIFSVREAMVHSSWVWVNCGSGT